MTDVAPPEQSGPPPGPAPIALAIAQDLVTRYHLRLADQRDGRLGGLAGSYELAAAGWTGPRAVLVAFYVPPDDPGIAGQDLAQRCDIARRWGAERLRVQGAQVCDILLIALRPLAGSLSAATAPGDPVRLGVAWVDAAQGYADALLAIPPGLPTVAELRARTRAVREGAPTPTLAAVDLAERQTVAGGYVAPVRRAMVTQPYLTYGLIAGFIAIWLVEFTTISTAQSPTGPDLCSFGALANSDLVGCPGDWWRFVSSAVLHDNTGVTHVLFNSLAMLFIGRLVEQLYGRLVLIGTFLITAIAGGLLWVGVSQLPFTLPGVAPSVSIGASGGISGLVGLLLMLGRIQGRGVPVGIAHSVRNYALTVIVLNVALTFLYRGSFGVVNNYAHIGGLIAGAVLGALVPPVQHIGGRPLSTVERTVVYVVVAASAVALVFALVNLAGSFGSSPQI